LVLTKNNVSILDLTEYNNNKFPVELFDLKKKYSLNNNALLINFTNDFKYWNLYFIDNISRSTIFLPKFYDRIFFNLDIWGRIFKGQKSRKI